MEDKFVIVINDDGYKVVCAPIINGNIYGHELKDGEQIIETDWAIANAMNKPKWDGTEWIDEEPPEQIDICPPGPTDKERITQLESEKKILAENVYQLASIMEIMLGGTTDGQTEATGTATAN